MKTTCTVLMLLMFGAFVHAQTNTPPADAAKIEFTETTYNFGNIPEGPDATHLFKFKNTGKQPLILSNVKPSCSCTAPSWPKGAIMPGETAEITVTYGTAGRPGPFTKTVTVTSNATEPNLVLYIKGEVLKKE